jgi:hypothetical protein
MYYPMPINMFFIVKNHWEPSFTDNPRKCRKNNVLETGYTVFPSSGEGRKTPILLGPLETANLNYWSTD